MIQWKAPAEWLRIAASAIVAALLTASPVGGQAAAPISGHIRGSVVDATSGAPVVAAQVRLDALHRGELTHEDGSFEFWGISPGEHTLLVQRIGYRPHRQTVVVPENEGVFVRIRLEVAIIELSATVISASVTERGGDDVLSATSVLSGAALDRQLDQTVAATIQEQPGVAVASIGPATARPVIRGLGGDRILMLEDGQRPGDLSSTSGDHAVAIEPLTAERIEVVRGPMSLLYGSSALGGVVNVIREEIPRTRPEHLHGTLVLQGNSVHRGMSGGADITGRLGRTAYRAEASARASGDLDTPAGRMQNTDARTVSGSVGASHIRDDRHVGASYRYYRNEYGIPGGFVGGHLAGVDIDMHRHTARAEAEFHRDGTVRQLHVSGIVTDYAHSEYEASGVLGTSFDQIQMASDIEVQHGAVGPFELGALGFRVQHRDVRTGGSLRTPNTRDYSLAGFLVEEMVSGSWRGQFGIRYDWARYEPREPASIFVDGTRVPVRPRTFGAFSGSLGAMYDIGGGVQLGTTVSRAYRTPDFNELYSDGPHLAANSYDVGDPELREETGVGAEAFVRLRQSRVRAEVTAFSNWISDFVFPSSRGRAELGSQGGRPRFQYTNEDARFVGMDGTVEWGFANALTFNATVSHVRATFTSDRAPIPIITANDTTFVEASDRPPFIPPLQGQVGIRWTGARWFAGTSARWADRQEDVGDFEEPTGGYVIPSLTAGVRLMGRSRLHTITLRVDNPFDAEYRNHLSRTKEILPEAGASVGLLYRLEY